MLFKEIEPKVLGKHTAAVIAALMMCPLAAEACRWQETTEAMVVERFCAADAVFVGEVETTLIVRDRLTETKIWPRETLKGQVGSPVYAISEGCDFRFQSMGRYLIFADQLGDTDYLCVSTCDLSRTFGSDDFVYRVVKSMINVEEDCSEEAAKRRQTERRDEWVRRLSEDDAKMYESTRQQQEENDATDPEW